MKKQIEKPTNWNKEFADAMQSLSYMQDHWRVFEDFLDYCLIMLHWQDLKEERFKELETRYNKENQHQAFAKAYYAMCMIADYEGVGFKDPFGDYFMEHFSSQFKGQFFTPEHVCDMMASMTIGDAKDDMTVYDPACGSGRTLLSAGKINRRMKFYGADYDLNCCKMTVINMMLNSMAGEVAWMNSLSMEHFKSWHLRHVMLDTGAKVCYYVVTGKNETNFIERLKNTFDEDTKPIKENGSVGGRVGGRTYTNAADNTESGGKVEQQTLF